MANMDDLFDSPLPSVGDSLSLEQTETGQVDVFFHAVPRLRIDDQAVDDKGPRVRILQVDVVAGHLTMFPTNNLTRDPLKKSAPNTIQYRKSRSSVARSYTREAASP